MTDDADAYFNAWSNVFGSTQTAKLLCTWHVKKNWHKNIRERVKHSDPKVTETHQKFIKQQLAVLANEADPTVFKKLLDACLRAFRYVLKEPDFADYFEKTYATPKRIIQWAPSSRAGSPVSTQLYFQISCYNHIIFIKH